MVIMPKTWLGVAPSYPCLEEPALAAAFSTGVEMQVCRSRTHIFTILISFLMSSGLTRSFGEAIAKPASINLVARLESLSVTAAPQKQVDSTGWGSHTELPGCLSITASWAIPSNRTTVRVIENDTPLFVLSPDDTGRPGRQTHQLRLGCTPARSEKVNDHNQGPPTVNIVVEAL